MANDGKLYIIITDEAQGGGGPNPKPVPPRPTDEEKQKEQQYNFITHQFYNFIDGQAKQFVNYAINNIGNFTGNYQTQANVQTAMNLGKQMLGILSATAVGAAQGGAVGAIAGFLISAGSTVINYAYGDYSYGIEVKKQNRNTEELRKLSGLDSRTNGSRI